MKSSISYSMVNLCPLIKVIKDFVPIRSLSNVKLSNKFIAGSNTVPQLFVNERHVGGLENIKVSSLLLFLYQNLSFIKMASVFGQLINPALVLPSGLLLHSFCSD